MKYRKKPVVIEAFLYEGNFDYAPNWIWEAIESDVLYSSIAGGYKIETLEGIHRISEGDYIIQGVKGELYPCKPDIFKATYELVE